MEMKVHESIYQMKLKPLILTHISLIYHHLMKEVKYDTHPSRISEQKTVIF